MAHRGEGQKSAKKCQVIFEFLLYVAMKKCFKKI